MNVPTPASVKAQIQKKAPESAPSAKEKDSPEASPSAPKPRLAKKDYTLPEHLTQRPFKENEALQSLHDALLKETPDRRKVALKRKTDRDAKVKLAHKLKDSGMSNVAIGKRMKINESTVRSLLKPPAAKNTSKETN